MHVILYGVFLLLHCVLLESSDTTKRFREHYLPEPQAKRFKQDTPREMLIQAVKDNDIEAAQKAFELGVHPDEIDKKEKYLFEQTYTKPALFTLFLEYGANPDLGSNLWLYDKDGSEQNVGSVEFIHWHMPLFVALRTPNFQNLDLLFEHGARFYFFTPDGIKTLASIISRFRLTQQQKQKLKEMHDCDSQGLLVHSIRFFKRLYLAPGVLFSLPEDSIKQSIVQMPEQKILSPLQKQRAMHVLCEPIMRNPSDSVDKYLPKMDILGKELFIKLSLSQKHLLEWYNKTTLGDKDKVFRLYASIPSLLFLYKKIQQKSLTDISFEFYD